MSGVAGLWALNVFGLRREWWGGWARVVRHGAKGEFVEPDGMRSGDSVCR